MPIPMPPDRHADNDAAYAAHTHISARLIRRGGLHINNFVSDAPKYIFMADSDTALHYRNPHF